MADENTVSQTDVTESQDVLDETEEKKALLSGSLAAKVARLEKRLEKLQAFDSPENAVESIDDLDSVEDYFDAIEGIKIQIDKILQANKAAIKRAAESLHRAHFLNGCPNCKKRHKPYIFRRSKGAIMREEDLQKASHTRIVQEATPCIVHISCGLCPFIYQYQIQKYQDSTGWL